jgi:hypothetical protein
MKRNLLCARPWFAAYNTDGGQGGGGDGGAGAGAGGAGGGAGDGGAGGTPPKTFTQEQVNKFLADDKRKHQDQIKQTVTQLEEMKKTLQLSDQQKLELETRIENLNTGLMTAEERAKSELGKKDKELKTIAETLTKERDGWKNNYAGEVITNQILKSSAGHKAVSADQMLDLLMPKTRLVEVLDTDGKTVKGYSPKVKLRVPNDKGEEIELDLSVEEAVKRMKDLPERFGNLFESGVNSGLGGKGSTGAGSGSGDVTEMAKKGADVYRANRSKFGLGRNKK